MEAHQVLGIDMDEEWNEISLLALFRAKQLPEIPRYKLRFQSDKFRWHVEENLQNVKSFVAFLHGIKDSWSPFSILDQGPDASIKKHIATFLLGSPANEKMNWIVHAANVLDLWSSCGN